MTHDKTSPHIKLDERNHVEIPLLNKLDESGWRIINFMHDLLTGNKHITPPLTEPQETIP